MQIALALKGLVYRFIELFILTPITSLKHKIIMKKPIKQRKNKEKEKLDYVDEINDEKLPENEIDRSGDYQDYLDYKNNDWD